MARHAGRHLLRLAPAGALAGVLAGTLAGCAPRAALPPPMMMDPGAPWAAGATLSGGASMPVAECTRADLRCGVDLQVWAARAVGDRLRVGALGFYGTGGTNVGGGLDVRVRIREDADGSFGVALRGGWTWGEVGIYAARPLTSRAWIYTQPAAGYNALAPLSLPVGVSIDTSGQGQLRVEGGLGIQVQQLRAWQAYEAPAPSDRPISTNVSLGWSRAF